MTIAKDFASKFAVAFVAVAMIFMAIAPAVQAAEAEDLQTTINDLLAQVAALKAEMEDDTTTSGSCVSVPAPLTMGAQNANVTALQNRLIADGNAIAAGATGYFGAQTKAALAAWQAANGVMPAVGYYGPITMAAMDADCTPADEDEDDGDDTSSDELQGEASLDDVVVDSASDDTIEEGAEDAEIAVATVSFVDGDASISRLDVAIDGGATDAWDVLDTVSVWVDGDMVADIDASDKDNYLDDNDGSLRFSGLDIVAMEDEELEITIAATIQDGVDALDMGNYNVSLDAIRFFDADGVATTEDGLFDLGTNVSFDIVAAGVDDEIIVKASSDDLDSTTLELKDDAKSDWYTVHAFDLDTDDSTNDITLNTIPVSVTVSSSTFDALVADYELVIDGQTIDTLVDNNGITAGKYTNGATVVLSFDVDGDVVIDAGDRMKAELRLKFNSLALGNEGVTVDANVTPTNAADIDAEGADDLDSSTSGSSNGDVHTLRTTGISTEMTDDSAVVTVQDLATNDYGTYTIDVDITAFNQDVFISTAPATSLSYSLVDGAGVAAVAGVRSVTLSSTGEENGGFFEINEGETETITVKVTYTPGVASTAARLLINSFSFRDTAGVPNQTQTTLPATDYRTEVITLVN